MRKSTIFISAVLTTFALVMLYRVASAYNDSKNAAIVAANPATSVPAAAATEPPASAPADVAQAETVSLGPVDAAQLAAKVVGNTNLLSAESSTYNGANAYMITFTNNDVVYVGLDGQILSVQVAPPTPIVVVNNPPAPAKHKNKNSGGGGGSSVSAPGVSNYSSDDNHDSGHDD